MSATAQNLRQLLSNREPLFTKTTPEEFYNERNETEFEFV